MVDTETMDTESLRICVKSILVCYVPNAIPMDRIIKLVTFIIDAKTGEYLKQYGLKNFLREHLPEDAIILNDDAVIHARCKDG